MSGRARFCGIIGMLWVIGLAACLATPAWGAPVNNKPVMTLGKGAMRCAEFSPDDRWCATGSQDGQLTLWDNWNGSRAQDFIGHAADVVDVRFSPDGASLYSVARDNTMRRWDVASGRQLACQAWPADPPRSVDINSSGTRLAVIRASGLVQFCDPLSLDPVSTVTVRKKNQSAQMRFSSQGNYLLNVNIDYIYSYASINNLQGELVWESDYIDQLYMTNDENKLIYESLNSSRKYGVNDMNGNVIGGETFLDSGQYVRGYLPQKDEILIQGSSTGNGSYIFAPQTYSLSTGESKTFGGPKYYLVSAKISRDGQFLEAASLDGRIWAWDIGTGELKRDFPVHDPSTEGGIEFSKDGRRLLVSHEDSSISEYEMPDGTPLCNLMLNEWRSYVDYQYAHFMNDQTKIAACESGGNIKVFDANNGNVLFRKQMDSGLRLLDLSCPPSTDSLVLIGRSAEHAGPVICDWRTSQTMQLQSYNWVGMKFISNDQFVAVSNNSYLCEVAWPSCTTKQTFRLDGTFISGFDVSPDKKRIIAASGNCISFVDLEKSIITKTTSIELDNALVTPTWIKYLPGGQRFVVGISNYDQIKEIDVEAQLRNASTGELIESFDAPGRHSMYGDVSPDGKYLAVAQDGRVYVYELPGPDAAASWALYE